jgi:hypothetical protein
MTHAEVASEITQKLLDQKLIYSSQHIVDVVERLIVDTLDLTLGQFKKSGE